MNDYKKAMGERLRLKRKELGLTQEQIAEQLDISIKHYSEAERGIIGFSVENLIKVSDILGISIDYLLKGTCIDYPVPVKIIDIYNKCPDSKKEYLLQILELESNLFS